MKELEKKISKAVVQLFKNHPFFASLAVSMEHRISEDAETAYTNGKEVVYSPDFLEKLDKDEVIGLIAHEVLHVAFLHHLRRGDRNPKAWNYACDYAINLYIKDDFALPEGGLMDTRFDNMSAEQIYTQLLKEENPEFMKALNGEADEGTGFGDVRDFPAEGESDKQQEEDKQIHRNTVAAQASKSCGSSPALDKVLHNLGELTKAKLPWRTILNNFATEVSRNDYNWAIPSKRYMHRGIYLPSLHDREMGELIVFVDNSCSVDVELVTKFFSEIQAIMAYTGAKVKIVCVDTRVNQVQDLDQEEIPRIPRGGGTCFKPGYKWLEENYSETPLVIYFTDGYCNSFPKDPGYHTLWAIYDNDNFKPPFGEVMYVE